MSQLMDVKEARKEIKGLSRNAKLYLQDRFGNGLNGIRMINSIYIQNDDIENSIMKLVEEIRKMGLFD